MEWPILEGGGLLDTAGGTFSASRPPTVTGGAANTKGSYVQLEAATQWEWAGFVLCLANVSAGNARFSLDIAIGGAGVEQVILPDFNVWGFAYGAVYIPLAVPKGVRVAVRIQSTTASGNCKVEVIGIPACPTLPAGYGRATIYGFTAGGTNGVALDSGGVANTKGAWVQLDAAIANPISGLIVLVQGPGVATITGNGILLDIGIGAAAAEQVVLADLWVELGTNTAELRAFAFPVCIPAGQRLAARHQCASTTITTTPRSVQATIIGLD